MPQPDPEPHIRLVRCMPCGGDTYGKTLGLFGLHPVMRIDDYKNHLSSNHINDKLKVVWVKVVVFVNEVECQPQRMLQNMQEFQ